MQWFWNSNVTSYRQKIYNITVKITHIKCYKNTSYYCLYYCYFNYAKTCSKYDYPSILQYLSKVNKMHGDAHTDLYL